MANNCSFIIKVRGSEESLNAFVEVVENSVATDKAGGEYFARVFDAHVWHEDGAVFVSGDCAWSVYVCMFSGSDTYFDQYGEKDGLTTLPLQAAKHGLEIEVFANEYGMAFAEYYRIASDGTVLAQAETDLMEWPEDDDEWDEFDPTEGVVFDMANGVVAYGAFSL